ncbi:MAG: hypothetical protein ACKO6E_07320, partial [Planctomycetota bacterium]
MGAAGGVVTAGCSGDPEALAAAGNAVVASAAGGVWGIASAAGVREGTACPAEPPSVGLKSDWL